MGPDYKAANDPGYYRDGNVSNDEVTATGGRKLFA